MKNLVENFNGNGQLLLLKSYKMEVLVSSNFKKWEICWFLVGKNQNGEIRSLFVQKG